MSRIQTSFPNNPYTHERIDDLEQMQSNLTQKISRAKVEIQEIKEYAETESSLEDICAAHGCSVEEMKSHVEKNMDKYDEKHSSRYNWHYTVSDRIVNRLKNIIVKHCVLKEAKNEHKQYAKDRSMN
jgi:hypothetical protein